MMLDFESAARWLDKSAECFIAYSFSLVEDGVGVREWLLSNDG